MAIVKLTDPETVEIEMARNEAWYLIKDARLFMQLAATLLHEAPQKRAMEIEAAGARLDDFLAAVERASGKPPR